MINIVVRSKRDADAIKAMLRVFYSEWDLKVYTLHGVRKTDDALKELESIVNDDCFYVLLLGREDWEMASELDKILPPNISVHVVPRAKIRNTRIERLAHEFDIARSKLRLAVSWSKEYSSFILGLRQGAVLEGYEYNPAYDVFLGIGKGFNVMLKKILGSDICSNPLLVRKFSGVHDIYCGVRRSAVLEIPDEGFRPSGKVVDSSKDAVKDISLDNLVKANDKILGIYENISKKFLSKFIDWADTVIVPWSGGKDSTATLLLALEVFPKNKIKVLFSDTGTEFPWTLDYVDIISEKLGIEVYRVYAGVDKGLLEENMPMPTHDNRWCTGRKIASVMAGIAKLSEGNTLIVTGDRDAESRRRSLRPPVRIIDKNTMMVTPIKLWSGAHVQLYILKKGLRLNPLYEKGFYRIGCYICPALRSWELFVMTNDPTISLRLQEYPLYKKFLEHRMMQKTRKTVEDKEAQAACELLNLCG